jgi:hypothetical protein
MRKKSEFTNGIRKSCCLIPILLFLATVLTACGSVKETASNTVNIASVTPSEVIEIQPDSAFYQFGKTFPVEIPNNLDIHNPHKVAQYSVFLLEQGRTEELLKQIGHVEKDEQLGQSFITFLREFGPDLARYKDKNILLKFSGVNAGKDTSVWYYYLVDNKGNYLDDKSWISLHRSNTDGRCALTGIFLNLPEYGEAVTMPGDILKS